jgi:hypothetical protein
MVMPLLARSVAFASFVGAAALTGVTAKGAFSPADQEGPGQPEDLVLDASADLPGIRPETGAGVCGGFSEEGRYDNLPVAWSFRLCESAQDVYEVQVRFRNLSERQVRFQYRVWHASPRRCDGAVSNESRLLIGEKQLRPGQQDDWPYTAAEIPRLEYRGQVWSCVLPQA